MLRALALAGSRPSLVVCVVAAACLAGCGGDGSSGDDPGAADAALPGASHTLRHDSAADFAAPGAALDHALVEPWGAIGPSPVVVGALLAHGYPRQAFTSAPEATWEALIARADSGRVYVTPSPLQMPGGMPPAGTGIRSAGDWTLLLEGELWLDAGVNQLMPECDGPGFIDLATPGAGPPPFRRVGSDLAHAATVSFEATTTGWYPIRIACTQPPSAAAGYLALSLRAPGAAELLHVRAHRLRAPGGGSVGLLAQGFMDRSMATSAGVGTTSRDGIATDYGNQAPLEVGVEEPDNFAVRWSGQLRVDTAGDHRFTVDSDDGQRLWIDGQRVLDAWPHAPIVQTSAPIALDVGWHDVVVDLRDDGLASHISVAMAAPAGGSAPLPASQLRPSMVRTTRIAGGEIGVGKAVPPDDPVGVSGSMSIDRGDGLTVQGIDGVVAITAQGPDLEIVMRAPDGTQTVLVPAGSLPTKPARATDPNDGDRVRFSTRAFDGRSVTGTWTIVVRDVAVAGSPHKYVKAEVAIHAHGGESPVATRAVYTSAPQDLGALGAGAILGLDRLTYAARTLAGASVAVRARTCDAADACAAAAWSSPLTSGQAPGLTPARFFQYQVELTSSGDSVPSLESLELAYRVAP